MTLEELASLGYACGVETLDQALLMVQMHYDAYTGAQLEALSAAIKGEDLSRTCTEVLGPEKCAKEDAELDAVLNRVNSRASDEPEFDF